MQVYGFLSNRESDMYLLINKPSTYYYKYLHKKNYTSKYVAPPLDRRFGWK